MYERYSTDPFVPSHRRLEFARRFQLSLRPPDRRRFSPSVPCLPCQHSLPGPNTHHVIPASRFHGFGPGEITVEPFTLTPAQSLTRLPRSPITHRGRISSHPSFSHLSASISHIAAYPSYPYPCLPPE